MKKIYFLLIIAVTTASMFFNSSCIQNANCEYCDSIQLILEEYIHRDSTKSELLKSYDKHLSQFGDIQDSIENFQRSIDSLKSVIKSNGKATDNQNNQLQKYIQKIRNLIAKNEELAEDLKNSGFQHASMDKLIQLMYSNIEDKQKQLKQTQIEIADLKTKVRGLESQVENLTAENSTLNTTIENLNTKVSRITGSLKVIQPKERKAKKIQQLNIKYTLKGNPDATKGMVNLYFRIHDQQGSLLKNPEGEFYYQGNYIAYTVKTVADYEGEAITGTVTWNKTTQNLEPGSYTVVMYIDDDKDSEDSFVLDK